MILIGGIEKRNGLQLRSKTGGGGGGQSQGQDFQPLGEGTLPSCQLWIMCPLRPKFCLTLSLAMLECPSWLVLGDRFRLVQPGQ